MADIDTNQFLRNLEIENELKLGLLITKGFKPFADRTISGLTDQDVQIVREVVQSYLSKAVDVSQQRYERRVERSAIQSRRQRIRGPVMLKLRCCTLDTIF